MSVEPRNETAPGTKLIRINVVAEKTGLAPSTIYKAIKRGDFPRGVRLSGKPGEMGGAVAWVLDEVEAWINAKRGKARA